MNELKQESARENIVQTTEENQTNDASTGQKPSGNSKKAVFIMRAEGQNWDDFQKACIEAF